MNTKSMATPGPIGDLIDLERYPLRETEHAGFQSLCDAGSKAMRDRSLFMLPDFLLPAGVARLLDEIDALAPHADLRRMTRTPYTFKPLDESLPAEHPRRRQQSYEISMLCRDRLVSRSSLESIFEWPPLVRFLSRVVGRELFCNVDPAYSCMVTLIAPGGEHGWHFDTNDFVATLMLRVPEQGGVFEYVPALRSAEDECYDEVAAILDGERARVEPAPAPAGALVLFHGLHALHHVTRVEGTVTRCVALLSYVHDPAQTFDHARLRGVSLSE